MNFPPAGCKTLESGIPYPGVRITAGCLADFLSSANIVNGFVSVKHRNELAKTVFAPVYPVIARNAVAATGINRGLGLELGCGPAMLSIAIADIGGGFGNRELREQVTDKMLKLKPQWICHANLMIFPGIADYLLNLTFGDITIY